MVLGARSRKSSGFMTIATPNTTHAQNKTQKKVNDETKRNYNEKQEKTGE